jgi:hypothetical protein
MGIGDCRSPFVSAFCQSRHCGVKTINDGDGMKCYPINAFVLAAFLVAAPAAARNQPPPPDEQTKPGSLFIAPSGKPYRADRGAPYPIVNWFAAADTNNDAFLTARELEAEASAFFKELDSDRDDEISPTEIEHYENEIVPEIRLGSGAPGGMGSRNIPSGGMPRGGMPGGGTPSGSDMAAMKRRLASMPKGAAIFALIGAPQPVTSTDTDFNRGITEAEMRAAARRRFAMLDPKNEGRLALGDLPRTPFERMTNAKR